MSEFHQLPSRIDTVDPARTELNRIAEDRAKQEPTAEMPSLNHLKLSDFDQVYEPAADTFLLLDALFYEIEAGIFDDRDEHLIMLELGCGSGVPTIFFRQQWQRHATKKGERAPALLSFVTDVNPRALEVTRQTAFQNGLTKSQFLELLMCDLAGPLLSRLSNSVDIILFNPPYVPTPDEEVGGSGIEASWAGGKDGCRVIDRSISQIARLVKRPMGVSYMITVDDNRPDEIALKFQELGLKMEPLFRRRTHNERLTVQKISCGISMPESARESTK
jgi:release factor glutamine methyltransferase